MDNPTQTRPNENLELDVPFWLDWEYLRYLFYSCCCFCFGKGKRFHDYLKVMRNGMVHINTDMDIIRFIRRLRMHGNGLQFVLTAA